MINVGVIGYGYWGPNVVRNFLALTETRVRMICDRDPGALHRAKELFAPIYLCRNYSEIIQSKNINVVAVITPPSTHFLIAKKALEQGKHIFVEKPFTATVKEAETLIKIAAKRKLTIMVDHTFLFTGAVRKIKEVVEKNILGNLYYYDATRVSLGLFQQDTNVIWDLAAHDMAILDYVVKNKPAALTAQGMDHMKRGHANMAYITIYFSGNMIAHLNVNWMSPVKIRTTMICGQKKMLLWDDLQPDEKIKVYDRGVQIKNKEGLYKLRVDYRSGDVWSPRVDHTEALKKELAYFVDCIKKNKAPVNDGQAGLRVVRLLEAANQSLKSRGKLIKL